MKQAVMVLSNTVQGHDHTILLLHPSLSDMQRLRQPLADGAKSKQSKTKLFHWFPFAMMVSHHQTSEASTSTSRPSFLRRCIPDNGMGPSRSKCVESRIRPWPCSGSVTT